MILKYSKHIAALALIACFAVACSSTSIIGSWKNANFADKQYGKLLIVGLSSDVVAKGSVELYMAKVLGAKNIDAMGAGGIFNPEVQHSDAEKKEISNKLKAEGYDGLLTVALVSQEEKTNYVQGSYSYAPYSTGYYGSYWGYYGYYAPQVYSPGYYTSSEIYTVEALLYDVETEELVWAARSESTDPSSLDSFSKEYAETVVYQMQKDQMLKTQ